MNRLFFVFLFTLTALYGDEPKALYLSWQKQPESTMIIQWITPQGDKNGVVYFRKSKEGEFWKRGDANFIPLPNFSTYALHRLELSDLEPDTEYLFRIGNEPRDYKFLTMPAALENPINFVVGGDIYHDTLGEVIETNLEAAAQNPRFAILGGDIAYTSNRYFLYWEKNERWIDFLSAWSQTMVDSEGHLIPLVAAIGNHDVTGRFDQTPEKAPFFYTLFPTSGYEALDFGGYLTLFLLDSGHTHPIEGEQSHWLYHALQSRSEIPHKFAIYHVPAYPSIRDFNGKQSKAIRKYWVPLFEHFGVNAAFEHHDHSYKRTYAIKAGVKNNQGLVYIGDGAWGVAKPRKRRFFSKQPWYLAATRSVRHFILVTLDKENRTYHAISSQGEIFDTFSN